MTTKILRKDILGNTASATRAPSEPGSFAAGCRPLVISSGASSASAPALPLPQEAPGGSFKSSSPTWQHEHARLIQPDASGQRSVEGPRLRQVSTWVSIHLSPGRRDPRRCSRDPRVLPPRAAWLRVVLARPRGRADAPGCPGSRAENVREVLVQLCTSSLCIGGTRPEILPYSQQYVRSVPDVLVDRWRARASTSQRERREQVAQRGGADTRSSGCSEAARCVSWNFS